MSVIIRIGLMPSGQTSAQAAAGGARPQRFGGDRLAVHVRRQSPFAFMSTDQILHHVSRRQRLAGFERRAASSHRPQETQASSSTSCRREKSASLATPICPSLRPPPAKRAHHAERVVANREVDRPGERVQQPRVGHQGDEAQSQHRVRPPQDKMDASGRLDVHACAPQRQRREIAHWRQSRQRRLGVDDSQPLDDVAGHADHDQQHEDADVGRAAREAAGAAPPAIEKHGAADDERDAERVRHEFVDAEVNALVKHGLVGSRPSRSASMCSMAISVVPMSSTTKPLKSRTCAMLARPRPHTRRCSSTSRTKRCTIVETEMSDGDVRPCSHSRTRRAMP